MREKYFRRLARYAACAVAAAQFTACGGDSSTPSSPSTPTTPTVLRAQISDPVGDAILVCRSGTGEGTCSARPNPTATFDLTSATFEVSGGILTVNVRFAPGTFIQGFTEVAFPMDTDQTPATGASSTGLGADYLFATANVSNGPHIERRNAAGTAWETVGPVTAQYLADGMNITIPMSMLGNDDGRMNVRVFSYQKFNAAEDFAPGETTWATVQ